MKTHLSIDYVELPAEKMDQTEQFFSHVFNWSFTHYGTDYIDCDDGGLMIGFYRASLRSEYEKGGALVTFYSTSLEQTQARVEQAGGKISKAIFSFPGGRRFQFVEPSGNEFGVWSDG